MEEIETAAKEDDDSNAAGPGERQGGMAKVEETEDHGSVAGDGEEEESTPEKGLSKMHECSECHAMS
jgi:hypothetical protein